jgi:cobalt/nickel transport system permease protein
MPHVADEFHEHGHQLGDHLYIHRHTSIHELPAHIKLVSAISFIFVAVFTPANFYLNFGLYAILLLIVVAIARLPISKVLSRMIVEIPFVLFAVIMPFVGPAPMIDIAGLSLSEAGFNAGFGILAKGTIGVLTSIILAATTPAREILMGLERLRVPSMLIQIATFMLRYSAVVTDELRRMKISRESRGFDATGPKQWGIIAQTAGALFIRSYERGERVHLAMMSRGYDGVLPAPAAIEFSSSRWFQASLLPLFALVILIVRLSS